MVCHIVLVIYKHFSCGLDIYFEEGECQGGKWILILRRVSPTPSCFMTTNLLGRGDSLGPDSLTILNSGTKVIVGQLIVA